MHPLAKLALLGTARSPGSLPPLEPSLDALIGDLGDRPPERRLLLAAGAWSVYALAGARASPAPTLPTPAPPDPRPVCSEGAGALVRELLEHRREDLLPEALGRMHRAGQRLPAVLLPLALDSERKAWRDALRPVLGQRAWWLAARNSAWDWALPASESPASLAELERRWRDGGAAQRQAVIRLLRAVDPGLAREWVEAAWPKERAAERVAWLDAMKTGLGPDDMSFLERVRTADRAQSVKKAAADALALLPESAVAQRMWQRAAPCLSLGADALDVTLPEKVADWTADGLVASPPRGVGRKHWTLMQVLARIPPDDWARHLHRPADAIVAAATVDSSFVIEGWSRAAVRYQAVDWAAPLWDWWAADNGTRVAGHRTQNLSAQLVALMAPPAAEARARRLLSQHQARGLAPLLAQAAWSEELAAGWLDAMGETVRALGRGEPRDLEAWYATLAIAAARLPGTHLGADIAAWALPEDAPKWHARRWASELDRFAHTLRMRQRIDREFPS